MQIETIDYRTIDLADARAIAELLVTIWPKPGRTVESRTTEIVGQWRDYRGPEAQHPRIFVVREGGAIIAHSAIFPRTIGTESGPLTVMALARVCTAPVARGLKLGRAVAKKSFALVDRGVFPFSLFQTTAGVHTFYDRLGAVAIENRFINSEADDPTANPWWNPIVMRYPAGPGWPSGTIDLRGRGW